MLISTPFLPLRKDIGYGGSERVVASLYDNLKKVDPNIQVYLAAPNGSEFANIKTICKPIGVFDIYGDRISNYDTINLRFEHISSSIKAIEGIKPDIIHVHDDNFLPFMRLYPNSLLTLHADPDNFWNPELHPDILNSKLNLIAISHHIKREYEKKGWKIRDVVYNGINIDEIPFNQNKLDYLYWIGVISPHKGLHVAINVAKQSGFDLVFSGIIGDKKYYSKYIQPYVTHEITSENDKMSAYMNLGRGRGRIVYTGEVNNNQKYPLYANAIVTLVPSLFIEPFGLVVVESLVAGTPVIGSKIGGIAEIINHEKNGFLVNIPSDSEELNDLNKEPYDSEFVLQTSNYFLDYLSRINSIPPKNCRERANMFSSEKMAREYIRIYNEIYNENKI
ncbi:MAG: glycosyltransferase [Candidatus Aenigmarchaeota archaeon]|nr:glycosyltransferase [Candidatus Aenigmarchaeota archaeon]